MKERVLVDITAAMEYMKKYISEESVNCANEHMEEYNSTHKRKIKKSTVDDCCVSFKGLVFGYVINANGHRYCDAGNVCIPIDDFIVGE